MEARAARLAAGNRLDRIVIDIELRPMKPGKTTTDHKTLTEEVYELSISGDWRGKHGAESCGQITEELARLVDDDGPMWDETSNITKDEAHELLELWERWHLNGLKPNCCHQPAIKEHPPIVEQQVPDRRYVHPFLVKRPFMRKETWHEAYRRTYNELAPCPEGYNYGSAWLVEPLPAEVVMRIQWFMDKGVSIKPSGIHN